MLSLCFIEEASKIFPKIELLCLEFIFLAKILLKEIVMEKGLWTDLEVKDLFNTVENTKKKREALKKAFSLHAQKYSRQPNSVRNYYYHEVDNLVKNNIRANRLGIDLSKHEKVAIKYFSKVQEDELIQKIEKMINEGFSVRKACFTLANKDVGLMLRYQNKYRNHLSRNSKTQGDNIIKFSNKRKDNLTDNDINSLFLGLVRLVKKKANEEISEKYKFEMEKTNTMLRKAIVEIGEKDEEINR